MRTSIQVMEAGKGFNTSDGLRRAPFFLWALWIANIAFFLVYLVKFGWASLL